MAAKCTEQEKQVRIFCYSLGINYDKLTPEEFVTLIQILEKSKNLRSPYNKQGWSSPDKQGRNKHK